MNDHNASAPAQRLKAAVVSARSLWASRSVRERQMLSLLLPFLAAMLLWWVGVAPALQTLRSTPAQLDAIGGQLALMQRQSAEAKELRAVPALNPDQATAALKSAVDRLGDKAKLSLQGERAVVTVTGISAPALRACLSELRSAARARPIEATLSKAPQGYSGNIVLSLGARP